MMIPFLILIASFGHLSAPVCIDVDLQGNVYVLDQKRDILVKYSASGDSLRSVGGFGSGPGEFDGPTAVCCTDGNAIFVADYNNHRIQKFTRELDYTGTISTHDDPDESARFGHPLDVAVTHFGEIVVLDGENHRIVVFGPDGVFKRSFGRHQSGTVPLAFPRKIFVDNHDFIHVLDKSSIISFDTFGNVVHSNHLPSAYNPDDFFILRDHIIVSVDSTVMAFPQQHTSQPDFTASILAQSLSLCYANGRLYSAEANHVSIYGFHPDSVFIQQ